MRRVPLPLGRRLFVGTGFLLLLVLTLPARLLVGWLGLDMLGLSARAVTGPVWSARAAEAQVAGIPLGDLRFGLHPLPLLAGRAQIGFSGDASGSLTVSRHRFAVRTERLVLPLGSRLAPLPVRAITLDGLDARFRDGLCEQAEGSARVELAGDPATGLPQSLTGPIRCEGGVLALSLTGGGGERLGVALSPAKLHAELLLSPADPAVRARLAATGFAPSAGGYLLAFDTAW